MCVKNLYSSPISIAAGTYDTGLQRNYYIPFLIWGFPGISDGKQTACNAGDLCLTPGSGRSPSEENGKPLQYSCLENPMRREAWWAIVHEVAKSQTRMSG